MDDVGGEHEGYAELRLLQCNALDAVDVARRPFEGRHLEADAFACQFLGRLVRPSGRVRPGHRALAEQHELVDLVLQRHAREQCNIAWIGLRRRVRAAGQRHDA
jgi:hypothetical protein